MEGEAPVEASTPVESTPAPVVESTPEPVAEGKPEGFDRVEMPPEVETRFNRVYGNMKRYENDAKELRDHNQKLIDTINQLSAGQQQIVQHLQTADFVDAESRLSSEREAAWNKGDVKAWNNANDQLNEIKIKKALTSQEKPRPVEQPRNIDGRAVVNGALDRGAIDHNSAAVVNSWMGETNPDGSFRRSWVNTSDPRNFEASKVAEAVLNSPLYTDKPMNEKLKEIDRRMGMPPVTTGQNVLPSSNLTKGKSATTMKLDPKIEAIAIRTKFAGKDPKLTAQDHINAYAKVVEKSQAKGTRR